MVMVRGPLATASVPAAVSTERTVPPARGAQACSSAAWLAAMALPFMTTTRVAVSAAPVSLAEPLTMALSPTARSAIEPACAALRSRLPGGTSRMRACAGTVTAMSWPLALVSTRSLAVTTLMVPAWRGVADCAWPAEGEAVWAGKGAGKAREGRTAARANGAKRIIPLSIRLPRADGRAILRRAKGREPAWRDGPGMGESAKWKDISGLLGKVRWTALP